MNSNDIDANDIDSGYAYLDVTQYLTDIEDSLRRADDELELAEASLEECTDLMEGLDYDAWVDDLKNADLWEIRPVAADYLKGGE